jgi:hypothetical protein
MPSPATWRPDIQRIVLLHNHTDESQRLAAQCGDELRSSKLQIPVVTHKTVDGGRAANAEVLAGIVEEGDIVGGVFGDGTTRDVLPALGRIPFISLAGGNARDIGRATHRRFNAPPSELIRRSVAVSAFALACTIKNGGDVRSEHAISYIGSGETARASATLETQEYRGRPGGWRRDFSLGMASMRSHFAFRAFDNVGEEQTLSDLTFSKGSRMAKLGRFPVRHWEPRFRVTSVGGGAVPKWMAVGGLLLGHAAGAYHEAYEFTPLTPIQMHFDGEPPVDVHADSLVRVELGEEFVLMTSRLRETVQ